MKAKRKLTTEELLHDNYVPEYTTKDLVRDIIMGIILVAAAFGWMLVMLLIISFITLSYLKFNIDTMLIVSGIFAAAFGVFYIIKKRTDIKKKDDLREQIYGEKEEKL